MRQRHIRKGLHARCGCGCGNRCTGGGRHRRGAAVTYGVAQRKAIADGIGRVERKLRASTAVAILQPDGGGVAARVAAGLRPVLQHHRVCGFFQDHLKRLATDNTPVRHGRPLHHKLAVGCCAARQPVHGAGNGWVQVIPQRGNKIIGLVLNGDGGVAIAVGAGHAKAQQAVGAHRCLRVVHAAKAEGEGQCQGLRCIICQHHARAAGGIHPRICGARRAGVTARQHIAGRRHGGSRRNGGQRTRRIELHGTAQLHQPIAVIVIAPASAQIQRRGLQRGAHLCRGGEGVGVAHQQCGGARHMRRCHGGAALAGVGTGEKG